MFHYVVPLVSLCHIVSQSKLAFGGSQVWPSIWGFHQRSSRDQSLTARSNYSWGVQGGEIGDLHNIWQLGSPRSWMKTYENSAWIMIDHWFDFFWPSVSQCFTWVHIVWLCLTLFDGQNSAYEWCCWPHRPCSQAMGIPSACANASTNLGYRWARKLRSLRSSQVVTGWVEAMALMMQSLRFCCKSRWLVNYWWTAKLL